MSKMPPFLNSETIRPKHSIALIVEGYEEDYYFKRLKEIGVFSKKYDIQVFNAKSASKIAAMYQSKFASNRFSLLLVVCDKDRVPTQYDLVVKEMTRILGEECAKEVIFFTCPCTLQIILSHFGQVELKTQAKPAARKDVEKLTNIKNYDAHQEQLQKICSKIYRRTFSQMIERVRNISTNSDDLPSTNMVRLFENLCSEDVNWIKNLNDMIDS